MHKLLSRWLPEWHQAEVEFAKRQQQERYRRSVTPLAHRDSQAEHALRSHSFEVHGHNIDRALLIAERRQARAQLRFYGRVYRVQRKAIDFAPRGLKTITAWAIGAPIMRFHMRRCIRIAKRPVPDKRNFVQMRNFTPDPPA